MQPEPLTMALNKPYINKMLTSISAALFSMMFWGTSCLGTGIDIGGTM